MGRQLGYMVLLGCILALGCKTEKDKMQKEVPGKKKQVVYQVFTRLFGNTNTANIPWGTLEENGVGKFSDFTEKALQEIKAMGVTHIWYTGVPHHDVITDYTEYGISNDDPDIVKGRAGSPYAVKDYYNVNPDLAENPAERLAEFEALIQRTHKAGLKLLIDIVPNHVARNYEGTSTPEGLEPFGAKDDTGVAYARDNDFYYIPDTVFQVPEWRNGYRPLGGKPHPLADDRFNEIPAKWTGNGSRLARPDSNDWYETVKINYGVRPDGSYDFDVLPDGYDTENVAAHYQFWSDKKVPGSWVKFKDIALYWLDKGVDGFRFDMAEMVPVEFWSYMNSHIKNINPEAFLLAEVYNPAEYRNYIKKGKMDYLYDKVEMYDSLKHIMQGHGWTDHIPVVKRNTEDIEHHLLHFLENHDEQRIASPDFAGDAQRGKPAMVVSATMTTAPIMIYFGQEVGEPAAEDAGFGKPTRTSIFDYIGVPHHQRWVNNKAFDGGQLHENEKALRDFYKRLLNVTLQSSALMGAYQELHFFNKDHTAGYDHRLLSYARWSSEEKLIVLSNFDAEKSYDLEFKVPGDLLKKWDMAEGTYEVEDALYHGKNELVVADGVGKITVQIAPLESFIFTIK
ncbi:alpha-amylase family glycosyl hydrolase [Maribacter sp. 2-571]|uniref:alpha-amylase family glycosyl hydrolase n=1 Tax=Maribacter sp. 2-571 TaxID=3417569 RepID=UPI003D33BBEF